MELTRKKLTQSLMTVPREVQPLLFGKGVPLIHLNKEEIIVMKISDEFVDLFVDSLRNQGYVWGTYKGNPLCRVSLINKTEGMQIQVYASCIQVLNIRTNEKRSYKFGTDAIELVYYQDGSLSEVNLVYDKAEKLPC